MITEPTESINPLLSCKTELPCGDIDYNYSSDGLTKREYFSAMAMQGICANRYQIGLSADEVADESVFYADALIAALNKEKD